jgi:hypothetical protein
VEQKQQIQHTKDGHGRAARLVQPGTPATSCRWSRLHLDHGREGRPPRSIWGNPRRDIDEAAVKTGHQLLTDLIDI